MLSVRSCSAEVMKRLTPSMCQVPSACWIALVRPAPTSEPASGSVSTMVAPQPLLDHELGAASSARSVPSSCRTCGERGPPEYMKTAGLAPSTSSATAQRRRGGAPEPPSSAGRSSAPPLAVDEGLVGLLERLGHGHRVRRGVEDRRVAVGVGEATRPAGRSASRSTSARMPRAVSRVHLGERPGARARPGAEHLEQVELEVPQVALVVAHRCSAVTGPYWAVSHLAVRLNTVYATG